MDGIGKTTSIRFADAIPFAFGAFVACHASATMTLAPPEHSDAPHPRVVWPSTAGAWARNIPQAPSFQACAVPSAGTVQLTWRVGPSSPITPCDYSALSSQTFELVLTSNRASVTIPLGDPYGFPTPPGLTYCRNRGDRPASDFATPIPDVVSMFAVSTGERATIFLVIRDGELLHVAFQNAPTMGVCSAAHYGPLASCSRHEWTRIADIRVGSAQLSEVVEDHGAPFDCSAKGCAFP